MALLRVENAARTFGGVNAASDVSFDADRHRITGLIGPNGAGKTTIVNLITGLLALSGGRILLDGDDISDKPPHVVARLGVARTFQNVRLLPESSVIDNVIAGFYAKEAPNLVDGILGLSRARKMRCRLRKEAAILLKQFGMERFAEYPSGALSYGHQRRVEMMRALATRPRLLLLDEPVAGMNEVEADALGAIFVSLARAGLAILLIEHNMRFVTSVCDDLNVLDSGRLIATGSPSAVMRDPAVVAAYLGAES